jgi:hypothetical protein
MQRRFLYVLALVAASLMAAASPAAANHVAGATYAGTVQGGLMTFTVTPDGSGISRFAYRIITPPGPCGAIAGSNSKDYVIPLPIFTQGTGHYFQDTSWLALAGAFPEPQTARGTFKLGNCTASWTATTTAAPFKPTPPSSGTTGPTALLWGKTTQKARSSITVGVFCPSEACTATPGATVSIASAGVYLLEGASTNVPKGGKARLKLKIPRTAQKAIKRALRRKKKVRARVTVNARNAVGKNTTRHLTIRFKR